MILLPLMLWLPLVLIAWAFVDHMRPPSLDVDVGRLRFRPARGTAAWGTAWFGAWFLAGALAMLVFLAFSPSTVTDVRPPCNLLTGNDCMGSQRLGVWAAIGILLVPTLLWLSSAASARGRLRPQEIVLDPLHLHLDQRSLTLAGLRSARIIGSDNPWTHRSLVLQTADEVLVVAVDGDRLDGLHRVVGHIERQAASAQDTPTMAEVPQELTQLRSAHSILGPRSWSPHR